jgi:outer membrane protein
MPRSSVSALLLLSLLTSVAPARAQTAPAAVTPEQPLSLEQAIALAVQKNFDLQLQGISTEVAKENVNSAKATFDPNITASGRRSVTQAASNTSVLEGSQTEGPRNDSTTVSVGVSERLPQTNGTVSVSTNVTRSATNSTIARLNPTFGNGISATVNQPLLQNAGRKVATANLERARLGLGIAYINYKNQVLTLIANTENAYYNLVAARESLRIRQLSLELAQKLFDENQARRTTGVMTDLDVLGAEVGVARARRSLIQQEQTVRDAEDALLNIINQPSFDSRPGAVKFDDYTGGAPKFAEAYKLARDFYPPTLSAEETLKQLQITLDVARRNVLPRLDLDASLGYTARAVSTGYGDVIANLPNDHGNNWSVGLTYQMPWGRHAEKANYRTAQLNLGSQKLRIDQLEQQLMIDVRTAIRSVETNLAAVEIASKEALLAEKQYDQQKARFDAGLTTNRQVQQFQDDLETARFNELSAKLTLRRAVTTLHRLQGTSIERYRVQLPQ